MERQLIRCEEQKIKKKTTTGCKFEKFIYNMGAGLPGHFGACTLTAFTSYQTEVLPPAFGS